MIFVQPGTVVRASCNLIKTIWRVAKRLYMTCD